MEHKLDQEEVDLDIILDIVEEITSEETADVLTEDDYTKKEESGIDWSSL